MEPFNAISSLAFLVPVVYFMLKLKGKYKAHSFLTYCMPLLFLGGVGSTLFHAFRSSPWLLMLDILPISMLMISVSVYFMGKLLPNRWLLSLIIVSYIALRIFVLLTFDIFTAVNIAYLLTGAIVFIPGLLYLKKTDFACSKWIVYTIFSFTFALIFRRMDFWSVQFISIGTHWLWHLFCATGAFTLGNYLYHIKQYNKNYHPELA